jgi:hypothetical protein
MHDGGLLDQIGLLVMNPGQIEHIGRSVTDFIACMSELIDQINDTVFQIDLWQTQNERRDGIE